MKILFLSVAATLFATPAFACPQLAGNYQCVAKNAPEMKAFFSQSIADGKTEYRFHFEGNSLLGEGESRIPVPHRWRQDQSTLVSVCKGQIFQLTDSSIDQAGGKLKIIHRFEKIGERGLRFRMDIHSVEQGTLFDYNCQR